MKTFTSLILGIVIMAIFTQCAGSQFINNPPFKLESAIKQHWTSDSTNNEGVVIKVKLKNVDTEKISFDKLFVDNRALIVTTNVEQNGVLLEVKYPTTDHRETLVLHKDPKKEFGNKPPAPVGKPPFELENGEMVISYSSQGITNFFKIKNVATGDKITYP